jgi:Xaa-Pro dipeptidase
MNIDLIKEVLRERKLDAWLFYDFHGRDHTAARILNLDTTKIFTRRWYYMIPAYGDPVKLCHWMESGNLDSLPGTEKHIYLAWHELRENLTKILNGKKKVAMQFSPYNMIPYVSVVDAGTADFIRSLGVEIVSSAELISLFESHLTDNDVESHISAYKKISQAKDFAFGEIRRLLLDGLNPTEFEIHQQMCEFLKDQGMTWDMGPIVSINEHNADPHFMPTPENSHLISRDDLIMIDVWAKLSKPGSIYADITWMAYANEQILDEHANMFNIVKNARDASADLVKKRFKENLDICGYEVDDAARGVIRSAGFGNYFTHRTGHNIGEEVHGAGVHMDNLETMDDRKIIRGSCFSIEPGIYIPHEYRGYRTEIDVYISNSGEAATALPMQESIISLL